MITIISILLLTIMVNTIVVLIATDGQGYIPKSEKWEKVVISCTVIYLLQVIISILYFLFYC